VSETIHEVAMQELAERIVEANQRDTSLAQTDPRNGDQQGARR
jgi:hypothetical protein